MQTIKLNKEEMLKLYKKTPFPEINLSKKDIEILKDLLFDEIPSDPVISNKKKNFSTCFIPDALYEKEKENSMNLEKFKPRSSSSFKPSSNSYKKYNNEDYQKKDNIIQRKLFSQTNNQTNNNNQDNNKTDNQSHNHKYNQSLNQNKIPKKNIFDINEFFLCKENSISITNSKLLEFTPQPKHVNLNKDLSFLVNYSNNEKKEKNQHNNNINDNIIIKGRKFSESSDSSGKKL
jgi:hypothetical protein